MKPAGSGTTLKGGILSLDDGDDETTINKWMAINNGDGESEGEGDDGDGEAPASAPSPCSSSVRFV